MPDLPKETATPVIPTEGGGDPADLTTDSNDALEAPSAQNWWQFETKDAAETWANNVITKRLARERKTNLEPLQQSHATLEAEVARLKPFEEAAMTETEKRDAREAAANQELEALRTFKAQTERQALVNGIVSEVGLPANLVPFLSTEGSEDQIREQATNLLNALSEGGSNTQKRTPKSKTPAPVSQDENGGGSTAAGGGGGNNEDSDDAMLARIMEKTTQLRKNGGISFG